MLLRRLAYSLTAFLVCVSSLSAQEKEKTDSLVRLLGCDELRQVEQYGLSFRQALGHARFEHNSTLLVCDTAIWNVNSNVINAYGNVRIIQNETVLSSDRLDYDIDENLAKFRGTVVQLQDKQKNTLRTADLDYNTKDSVAVFRNGGAMKDKDGQIIESKKGSYESKFKTFIFTGMVNMYTDSVFVKTERLEYNAETSMAYFGHGTNAWKDDSMLSSDAGWYDRANETFLFHKKVHLMTPNQEAWADSLKYYRAFNNAEMFGNVELLDTTRNVSAVAGYMQYIDSLRYMKMARDPAVIAISEQDGQVDTTYVGADTLIYRTVRKCDIPDGEFKKSDKRLEDINSDAVTAYRRNAAEKARAAAEEAKKKMLESDPNALGAADKGARLPAPWDEVPDEIFPEYARPQNPPDSLLPQADSLLAGAPADSLMNPADSTLAPKDTTGVGFLQGIHNVKVFRKDMQVVCDLLEYNDLDSLVRLYEGPLVWNELNRQYSADSITVVIRNKALEKASLMSEAFIIIKEDSLCFDQIRAAEMMAYFDSTGVLSRFDAMGGASGLFYIEENGAYATVNKFDSKMMTAVLRNGEIDNLNYFEDVKTNAYPIVQLAADEKVLKGFLWQPEKRPEKPSDITSYTMRKSERDRFEEVSRPGFLNTETYFPGYMDEVHRMLASQDSLKRVRRAEQRLRESQEKAAADTLALTAPSEEEVPPSERQEPAADQASVPKPAHAGLTEKKTVADTSAVSVVAPVENAATMTPADSLKALKQREKAERIARNKEKVQQRKDAREARWAEKDAKDAVKAEKKAARQLVRKRKSTLKAVQARDRRESKEQAIMDRYMSRFQKQKDNKDAREEARLNKKKQPSVLTPPEDKGIPSLGGKEHQHDVGM